MTSNAASAAGSPRRLPRKSPELIVIWRRDREALVRADIFHHYVTKGSRACRHYRSRSLIYAASLCSAPARPSRMLSRPQKPARSSCRDINVRCCTRNSTVMKRTKKSTRSSKIRTQSQRRPCLMDIQSET